MGGDTSIKCNNYLVPINLVDIRSRNPIICATLGGREKVFPAMGCIQHHGRESCGGILVGTLIYRMVASGISAVVLLLLLFPRTVTIINHDRSGRA